LLFEQEWLALPKEEKIKFVRIDAKEDVDRIEKEAWVQKQNDMIRAEQLGTIGVLGETIKQTMENEISRVAR
jgi:hypothetical protein